MIIGLTQLATHNADHPTTWSVVKYEPGSSPQAAGLHDEIPAELLEWAKELNATHPEVPFGYGIVSRDSITSNLCVMDAKEFASIDGRGRFLVAVGLSAGASRPAGLGTAAAWRLCPALIRLIDRHYESDSRPLPPGPPPAPRELTPAEKLAKAKADLAFHAGGALAYARGFAKTAFDQRIGDALATAIDELILARLAK